jgi:hypothetical protein
VNYIKLDLASLDFEYDPVTVCEYFQFPILSLDHSDAGQVDTVWYEVTMDVFNFTYIAWEGPVTPAGVYLHAQAS